MFPMLSENIPVPATFCGSGRILPQLSADMDLSSEYNLQFSYTALPHTGDQTMPENLSHRWLLSYPAVLLFHIHCKEIPAPVLTDYRPGYHNCR